MPMAEIVYGYLPLCSPACVRPPACRLVDIYLGGVSNLI